MRRCLMPQSPAEAFDLNERALRARARDLIADGILEELPDHSLRLTRKGEKRLGRIAPDVLQRLLRRGARLAEHA